MWESVTFSVVICGNLFFSISYKFAQIIETPEAHFDCNKHGLKSARAPAVRFEPSSGYSKFENINTYQIASLKLR